MPEFIRSLKAYILFSLVLGLAYPVFITIVAQAVMPDKADGSLEKRNGVTVGSALIGQAFTDHKYFHGRPSACDYDATNSSAENLGPSSKKLMEQTAETVKKARVAYNLGDEPVPADMVLSSASGLDPHISRDNAMIQAKRVARSRGLTEKELDKLIDRNTDRDFLGLWGRPGVNVLRLNLALDDLKADPSR